MNNKTIEQLAHALIAHKINAGQEVQMEWAVTELINGAGTIKGKGVAFYTLCAREHVYRIVKKCVDKYEGNSVIEDKSQILLEGFEYLQVAYTLERDDQRVLIPIQSIPDSELLKRAEEYDKLASGLKAHAKEIRDYVASRTGIIVESVG